MKIVKLKKKILDSEHNYVTGRIVSIFDDNRYFSKQNNVLFLIVILQINIVYL